jgi:cobalamin synthase
MTTSISKWTVPAVGFVIGLLMAAALMGRHASPGQVAVAFVIVAGYAIALRALQSRSDLASLLSGLPRDERWESINLRALSLAAQCTAVVLVSAFLVTQFGGGDSTPYAWVGVVFAFGYLGGLAWYRRRS